MEKGGHFHETPCRGEFMIGRKKPTQKMRLQARKCWTAMEHFLPCGSLYMVCCDI